MRIRRMLENVSNWKNETKIVKRENSEKDCWIENYQK